MEELIRSRFKECIREANGIAEKRERFIEVAKCRKKALLEFIYHKGGMATWNELREFWNEELVQRKDFFGRYLRLMIEEGLIRHPVRGLYIITPKGAAFIGKKHPIEELSEVRRLVMEAANVGDATVQALLNKALLKLDDYITAQRGFWGWDDEL